MTEKANVVYFRQPVSLNTFAVLLQNITKVYPNLPFIPCFVQCCFADPRIKKMLPDCPRF